MCKYIKVKESQFSFYKDIPLFYLSDKGEGVLFKKSGVFLDANELSKAKGMEIFIRSADKKKALSELIDFLNKSLVQEISTKGVIQARTILTRIVQEALSSPEEMHSDKLPETFEILFDGFKERTDSLKALLAISKKSSVFLDHSVNVFSLTMLYCIFNAVDFESAKRICLAALTHDIGTLHIDLSILENGDRLTDDEFETYKTHTAKGYDILKETKVLDNVAATVALEHHEKLDGTGYPKGKTDISYESQIIGLIDSYESLTYRAKSFRKVKTAFDSLTQLKHEVVGKKYSKDIFKDFCASLTR